MEIPNYNGNWHSRFLKALAASGVVARACQAAGVSRGAVERARKTDADFSAAFDDAMEDALDFAEEELWRRAVHGDENPVIHQGRLCFDILRDENGNPVLDEDGNPQRGEQLTVRKYSDSLLQFLLQGRRKGVFANRTELTGADGAALGEMDEQARAARIAQIIETAKGRQADGEDADGDNDDLDDLV